MKVHSVEQGSVEWMQLRAGIPTVSEFDALITPLGEIRTGETPKTYLAKKVAEAWQGGPLLEFNVFDMEAGQVLEKEARPWFEARYEVDIKTVGFITTDDGRIGCSPDGLIGDHSGLEIKCPKVETHVGYLLNGKLPKDYVAQVHGSMFVTGYQTWNFLSYRRRFPNLVIKVERDDKIQVALKQALGEFLQKFDAAMKRMEEINGGPRPQRYVAPVPENWKTETTEPDREDLGIIP